MDRPPGMPRGIFNNNPGNIELDGTNWLGLCEEQTDRPYAQFTKPEYGIRAIAMDFRTMQRRDGISTLSEAITKWAPPEENDTSAYIRDVCAACSVQPNNPTDFTAIMLPLVKEIVRQECGLNQGQPWYPDSLITYGISLW